jgi:hypothetical protein
LTGAADEDQRSPRSAVGDEGAAELGAQPGVREEIAEAGASLGVTGGGVVKRRGLALRVG